MYNNYGYLITYLPNLKFNEYSKILKELSCNSYGFIINLIHFS